MFRNILSVGGFTLLSRLTGFVRDVVIAAIMGTGLVADAFVVAQRLPNHFRAIFGEGAFNAAFVPTFSSALERDGAGTALLMAGRIMTMLVIVLTILTGAALIFMPEVVAILAPGFPDDPVRFQLAVTLTRITFPYLLFITLVTLLSGVLNASDHFAAPAAAPILLNVAIVAALAVAWLFPSAGHAAAWGVFAAGILELALVGATARSVGRLPRFERPVFDAHIRKFLRTLGPAVIGSAGVQIAMFADTVIASLLPVGAVSSLYFADRLYQLPVGVIGIAAGTVLLPTMSKRLAAGDAAGASAAQNRAIGFTLVLSAPFFVAFLLIPDVVMRALFMRGAFTEESALAAGAALAAYGVGLPAVVLIRSAVASFYSRQDTATPLIASFSGIAVNLCFKLLLFKSMGAAGLALATAIGAWVNLVLLVALASRGRLIQFDATLRKTALAVAGAAAILALAGLIGVEPAGQIAARMPTLRHEVQLALLVLIGGAAYGGVLLAAFKVLRVPLRRV